jgi:hypothetical protein
MSVREIRAQQCVQERQSFVDRPVFCHILGVMAINKRKMVTARKGDNFDDDLL